MMSFGGHIRKLREGAGLSRAELARKAAVPASTLRNWEGGRGFPGLPVLLRLAAALGVTVERIAEGVDDLAEDEPADSGRDRAGRDGQPREELPVLADAFDHGMSVTAGGLQVPSRRRLSRHTSLL
jgi:transcriptional regulator with XRE-family HTH domain